MKWKIIKEVFADNRKALVALICISLFSIISLLIGPYITSVIYSFEELNMKTFFYVCFLLIISYFLQLLFIYIKGKFSLKFKINETKKMYRKVMDMKYDSIIDLKPMYLVERTNQTVNSLSMFITNFFSSLITYVVIVGVILAWVLSINVYVFLIMIVMIPVNIFGFKLLNGKLQTESKKLQKVCSSNFAEILNVMGNVDYIKQNGEKESIINLINPNITRIEEEMYSINKLAGFSHETINIINNLVSNILIIYIGFLMFNNNIIVGNVIVIIMLLNIYFNTIKGIVSVNLNYRDVKGSFDFIKEEIENNFESDGESELLEINNIVIDSKEIRLGEQLLIEDVYLVANRGDIIGITGDSGSGKSTIAKFLLKFREINNIKINDIDIRKYTNESLRRKISYYSQNTPILSKTLADNISMGRSIENEEFEKLFKIDFIKEFFSDNFDMKYEISENGINLSGGEKQKIALMRLFLEKTDLIILDEITNAIDQITSDQIIETIIKYSQDKIIIIITHNENTSKYFTKTYKITKDKKLEEQHK